MQKISLNQEQQKLIKNNYGLVKDFVTRSLIAHKIPSSLRDDFISEALWRFCISALKFEEERGFQFSTYAYGGFEFSLKKILSKKNQDDIIEELVEDIPIDYKFKHDFLEKFIEELDLPEQEIKMIKDRFYNSLTFRELGEKYGYTKQNAHLIMIKILKKIHRKIISEDLKIEDFYSLKE